MLKKEDLDDAFKDKRFPDSAKVELLFESDEDVPHGILLALPMPIFTLPLFL